jgi:flagellar FliL protein
VATKPDAEKPEPQEPAKAPAKSKKLLIIILAVIIVLALAGVGGGLYMSKQRAAAAAAENADGEPALPAAHAAPKAPPAYLPLENMVVNLADPGGEKVAQIGITLEVVDAHAVDTVKAFLPSIRSGILMLISQRTAEELLTQKGKEKLAADILHETSVPFGGGDVTQEKEPPVASKKKPAKATVHAAYPVIGVLFSSFIVQ